MRRAKLFPPLSALLASLFLFSLVPAVHAEAHRSLSQVPPALKKLAPSGNLDGSARLHLSFGLPLRHPAELTQFITDLYDPSSPIFRHFLTPEEFTSRFGPTQRDYEAVIHFMQENGLSVRARHPNRMVLEVEGPAAKIESVFHTHLAVYKHPTEPRTFYAPSTDPIIPQSLALQDVQGLDNYHLPRPMSLRRSFPPGTRAQALTGSAPDGSFRGSDFRAAYAPNVRLNGTGQVVGLVEYDGYYSNDIALYETDSGIRNVPLQNVFLDGVIGVAHTGNREVALDIETCISMAPGLSKVMVYEGSQGNSVLSRMATDNVAKQLSSSWTYSINLTTEQLFAQLAAQGQTMFQASGDVDAYYNEIPAPSDNPNITLVGGTTLTTTGPGGAWVGESTWNWGGDIGSSGGVSLAFSIPTWQKGLNMTANQGSTLMRNLPDVALTADSIWVRDNNGSSETLGGTSAAAPLWAGFMALINQQAKALGGANIGFLNPALYTLGKGTKYSACFHDITTGNNTDSGSPSKYYAVSGYDLCTGWGTPAGQPLINALTGVTNVSPAFLSNTFAEPSASSGQAYFGSIANQAADPDPGDTLTFSKRTGPTWLNVGTNGLLSGTPGFADLGTNIFNVKVTDAGGLSATSTMVLTVVGAPAFVRNPFIAPTVNAGVAYSGSLATNTSDPNPGASLFFSKASGPAWLNVSSNGFLSGIPAQSDAGTNVFDVVVQDSTGSSSSGTVLLMVNGAPYFFATELLEPVATAGRSYSTTLASQARDPNPGDALTFSKLSGPSWLVVSTNGTLSGTPGYADSGTNLFRVQVADSGGLSNTAGMDIYVALPLPVVLKALPQQNQILLTWTGGSGQYQLQSTARLIPADWTNSGPVTTVQSLTLPITNSSFFYRVQSQ